MVTVADRIQRLDHVGIAVPRMAEATHLFVDVLGGKFLTGGDNVGTGLRLVQLSLGGFKVELMESLRDTSLLAPWLDAHGPGFHHMTFMVDDVLDTVSGFDAAALRTIGTDVSSANWSQTFLHPRDGLGALLQFAATALDWSTPVETFTLDDVLAAQIEWLDFVPCWRLTHEEAT